jgi:hypothetical protein
VPAAGDRAGQDTRQYGGIYQSVGRSVEVMTSPRLAYDDLSTPAEMGTDALATVTALGWVPSTYVPREAAKRGEIEIPEATARLAAAMNLQLDGE